MAKQFSGYTRNAEYQIGCTGETVCVYDNKDNEIAKFKDIKNAYIPMICPNKNIFVVKSAGGEFAVYSLDSLKLIKKFRFSKVDCCQYEGFCFSPDGKLLYNIEQHISTSISRLAIYETDNFSVVKYLFNDEFELLLEAIEYDITGSQIYILALERSTFDYIVCELIKDKLENITSISQNQFEFLHGYKDLELHGFTERSKEWSSLRYHGFDLDNIESKKRYFSEYVVKTN